MSAQIAEKAIKHEVFAGLTATKAADDGGGQTIYTFLASNDTLDRQGEIVSHDGWELDAYLRYPVVVDSHSYGTIKSIVGKAHEMRLTDHGLEADIIFNTTELGMTAKKLVDEGNLRGVSVGFKPLEIKYGATKDESPIHVRKQLLEISMVVLPANPDALRLRSLHADETPDDGATVVKAGRVLSAKNESRLKQALTLLTEVLAELGEPEPVEQTIDIDLAALKALAGRE